MRWNSLEYPCLINYFSQIFHSQYQNALVTPKNFYQFYENQSIFTRAKTCTAG